MENEHRLSAPAQADAPGDGARYVLLNPGDVIQDGDEVFTNDVWVIVAFFGMKYTETLGPVRRRAPNAMSVREAAAVPEVAALIEASWETASILDDLGFNQAAKDMAKMLNALAAPSEKGGA